MGCRKETSLPRFLQSAIAVKIKLLHGVMPAAPRSRRHLDRCRYSLIWCRFGVDRSSRPGAPLRGCQCAGFQRHSRPVRKQKQKVSYLRGCLHTQPCRKVILTIHLFLFAEPRSSLPSSFLLSGHLSFSVLLALPVPEPKIMSSALSYLQPGVRTDDSEAFKFFILLIIGGNVLIPIMVLASFVQGNKYSRSPIFMNFCIGWIVYSTGFLLL